MLNDEQRDSSNKNADMWGMSDDNRSRGVS